jgi:hypothetical protein
METKTIKDFEKELKAEKKKYDKLTKQIKKCKGLNQYEMMREDVEDCRQDIIELELVIQDMKRKEKKEKELNELLID